MFLTTSHSKMIFFSHQEAVLWPASHLEWSPPQQYHLPLTIPEEKKRPYYISKKNARETLSKAVSRNSTLEPTWGSCLSSRFRRFVVFPQASIISAVSRGSNNVTQGFNFACLGFGCFLTKPVHNIPFHILTEDLEKVRETGIERRNEGRRKSEELIDKGTCRNES